jgi:hypothetical protein
VLTLVIEKTNLPILLIFKDLNPMAIIENTQIIDGEEIVMRIAVADATEHGGANERGRSFRGIESEATDVAEKVIASGRDVFAEGIKLARGCAIQTIAGLKVIREEYRPDEVDVKLAIALKGEAGAVLVNVGAEAQLEVTLKWKLAAKTQPNVTTVVAEK